MSTCIDQLWLDLHPEILKTPVKSVRDRSHPYAPGTGPRGQSCGTCDKARHFKAGNKSFYKCNVIRASWTHSVRTDIRLKDPACRSWEPRIDKIEVVTTRERQ